MTNKELLQKHSEILNRLRAAEEREDIGTARTITDELETFLVNHALSHDGGEETK